MNRMRRSKEGLRSATKGILFLAVVLAVVLLFCSAIHTLEQDQRQKGKDQLEESIRRAAVACYATEGVYPPDMAYLQEHFGIQVDESRYVVFYEVFAENMMPDITVVELD